ncbi:MAG TPA: hypothetical protein VMZ90_07285, partial [Vicinamibacterales bacterium]|nr:hypothetical protein [Vicinamibacterales bacterium]
MSCVVGSVRVARAVIGGLIVMAGLPVPAVADTRFMMREIVTTGVASFSPRFINAAGQVTGTAVFPGSATYHAFLLSSGGQPIDLGTFGGSYSYPLAINDAGDVIGQSQRADGSYSAF